MYGQRRAVVPRTGEAATAPRIVEAGTSGVSPGMGLPMDTTAKGCRSALSARQAMDDVWTARAGGGRLMRFTCAQIPAR